MTKISASDPHPAASSVTPSARALYERRENILSLWIVRVKKEVPTAGTLINPVIVNTIPLFLESLAEALCEECSKESLLSPSNTAQEHGGERARVTRYGPEQIIHEYRILREVVRDQIRSISSLTERDDTVLQRMFDKAIQESMIAYFLVHGRIREQFVATLTHDLRNPLGAVKLAAEIIQEVSRMENETDPTTVLADIRDLSVRILRNIGRADRMVQEMLDASVVQAGERLAVQISAGDIEDIVHSAINELSAEQKKRLKVELISVKGFWDIDAFRRSIENLISNAFKYGEEGTLVTLKVAESHGRVMVSVHNRGNPIPVESQESLFQVFRRTEAAKTSGKKGWGVGLALARSTAESMGGSLGFESSFQHGTTFTIDVPEDSRPFQESPTSSGEN